MSKQATARRSFHGGASVQRAAVAPGKTTSTQEHGVSGLHGLESRIDALRDRQLPLLRAALDADDVEDARATARRIRFVLIQIDQQLASADPAAVGELIAAREQLGAELDPVLAQVPAEPAAAPVQLFGGRSAAVDTHEHAQAGVAGTGGALPHADAIQASFGPHDVSGIRAHVGGAAASAADAIGAEAYATGNDVAFASSPSLFVAAHEAAHVVQQRAGVQLLGGVGEAGDRYEQHADAVAERVVAGESAAELLGEVAGAPGSSGVQRRDRNDKVDRLPKLSIEPRRIDAGSTRVGEPKSVILYVNNEEDETVWLEQVSSSVRGTKAFLPTFADEGGAADSVAIAPGDYAAVRVMFAPPTSGDHDGFLDLVTGNGTGYTVALHGVGVAAEVKHGPQSHEDEEANAAEALIGKTEEKLQPLEAVPTKMTLERELGSKTTTSVQIWNRDRVIRYLDDERITGSTAFAVEGVNRSAIEPDRSVDVRVSFDARSEKFEHATLEVAAQQGPGVDVPIEGRPQGKKVGVEPTTDADGRLKAWPATFDVGEQVVGSDHTFALPIVWNQSEEGADGEFAIAGDGFELKGNTKMSLQPTGATDMGFYYASVPMLRFRPTQRGRFASAVRFTATWQDGGSATRTLSVTGEARELDDAPRQAPAADGSASDSDDVLALGRAAVDSIGGVGGKRHDATTGVSKHYDNVVRSASRAAAKLARAQAGGVRVVADEAATYVRKPPELERSLWWDLVETALMMGISGVAGVVAKDLAPRLYTSLLSTAFADDVDPAMAGKIVSLSTFTTELIKEGLKTQGKEAIKNAFKGGGSDSHKGGGRGHKPGSSAPTSTNGRINFFEEQTEILETQADMNAALVDALSLELWPVLEVSPPHAEALMRSLASVFEAAAEDAKSRQAQLTAQRWCTYVARASQGEETAELADGGAATTTDLTAARGAHRDGQPAARDGVVDVVLAAETGRPRVVSARVNGVAQEVADHLLYEPLLDVMMPIRIIVGENVAQPTIVTRDEAGRIRATGDFAALARLVGDDASSEAQAHRGATELVRQVLSVPLRTGQRDQDDRAVVAEWGVRITTDDGSGTD